MDSRKKKEVKEAKLEWVKLLNKTLWAYRTTKKTSTRESPFLLTYESEAMILADIGCPKYMVVYYTSKGNEQGLRANLDLLKKSWLTTTIKNEVYQHRTTQYYNARVKNRRFKFGDLVLRKLEATDNRKSRGKRVLKWYVLSKPQEW